MWIKICANTNLEDALLAAELGAHAVGFVFAPSPRRVTAAQVAAITPHLPAGIEKVGVFDTHTPDEILQTVDAAGLTGIQLHRTFDSALSHALHQALADRVTLTQTIHWDATPGAPDPAAAIERQLRLVRAESSIDRVLIDSRFGAATGGTGIPFDWQSAADVLSAHLGDLKLIVAGGLRPDNVEEAIHRLNPWGVDVASGVELSAGKKDPQKLEAFIKKASRCV